MLNRKRQLYDIIYMWNPKKLIFNYLIFYCCSVTVVAVFLPLFSPASPTPVPSVSPHPVDLYRGSFIHIPSLDPSPSFPHFPSLPSPLVRLFFISMSLVLLCSFALSIRFHLQMRLYDICLLLSCLFHLSFHSPVPPMLSGRIGAPSFFLLCSIPLLWCKCTSFFLIHSFIDWHLYCFQHLATVNNAAMNIGVHGFFEFVFLRV